MKEPLKIKKEIQFQFLENNKQTKYWKLISKKEKHFINNPRLQMTSKPHSLQFLDIPKSRDKYVGIVLTRLRNVSIKADPKKTEIFPSYFKYCIFPRLFPRICAYKPKIFPLSLGHKGRLSPLGVRWCSQKPFQCSSGVHFAITRGDSPICAGSASN